MSKCKRCGYCKHCGRSDAHPWVQPWPSGPIWISPTPWGTTAQPPLTYPYTISVTDGTSALGSPTVTYQA